MKNNKDLVKINDKLYKKKAFMIEEHHPAIGRILIIDDIKFKVLDESNIMPSERTGTFIAKLTQEDEDLMKEYDEQLDELSEKLVKKVDLKRLIKEQIKHKPLQEIKTGLFILKEETKGNKVDVEHHKGCYCFKMHLKNQTFEFASVEIDPREHL